MYVLLHKKKKNKRKESNNINRTDALASDRSSLNIYATMYAEAYICRMLYFATTHRIFATLR